VLGGMGNIGGVVVGAIALSMLNRFVLPALNDVPPKIGLDFDVTSISGGIFGFFLLLMMLLRPEGLIPNRRRKFELHEAELDEAGDAVYAVRS
jgi:branched-chain amino acid transport system permease protein